MKVAERRIEARKGGMSAPKAGGRKGRHFSRHLKKGRGNENLVTNFLVKRNWRVLSRNAKFFGVEIDLIAQKDKRTVAFEIKSLSEESHLEKILAPKQKERLKAALEALSPDFPEGIELMLAAVNKNQEVAFFPVHTDPAAENSRSSAENYTGFI